jgi:hypothetical protein
MVKQTRDERIQRAIPQTQANRRFSRYKKGQHKMVRGISLADDADLREAIRVWHSFEACEFEKAEELLVDADFSPEDIRRFCVSAMEFQDEYMFGTKLGYQLGAMINSSSHGRFELDLDHLETTSIYLCKRNRKHVTIRGDVGQVLGWRMRSGTIHLAGGAEGRLGDHMEGGRIIVSGDAGRELGSWMSGGLIVVKGDVGGGWGWAMGTGHGMSGGTIIIDGDVTGNIGYGMSGGEIHLNGEYDNIPRKEIVKGRIFHKGKLIVDK